MSVARKKILKAGGGHSSITHYITCAHDGTEDAFGENTSASMCWVEKWFRRGKPIIKVIKKLLELIYVASITLWKYAKEWYLVYDTNLWLNKSKEILWIKIVSDKSLLL